MAINDVNGNQITQNFYNVSDGIINIEFGAGKGYFGKKEFPSCYTTDKKTPSVDHFILHPLNYDTIDCHYIDFDCDFFEHNFNNRKFNNIILCNPYGFGYYGYLGAQKFFNRAGEILNDNGKIIVLCTHSNKFAKKDALEDYLSLEDSDFKSNYEFMLEEFVNLDANHPINQGYKFHQSCLNKKTIPNQKLVITKVS